MENEKRERILPWTVINDYTNSVAKFSSRADAEMYADLCKSQYDGAAVIYHPFGEYHVIDFRH